MNRKECKVINCRKSSLKGQEGYCPEHFKELERVREENDKTKM